MARRALAALPLLAVAALLGVGGAALAARPVPRDAAQGAAGAPGEVGKGLRFDVRFDNDVIEQYVVFRERGDATAEELKRWVRLPGNTELLRQGRIEGGMTPDLLEEAARVSIHGHDFPGPDVMGVFEAWSPVDLRVLYETVRRREPEMAAQAGAAIRPYIPPGVPLPPLFVRFHLGGTWDGRTTDAVYINLGLYNKRGIENLPALDALLVHELFHRAHGAIFPGVEDWSSRQSALYSVLLRMQQEGIARHIEYGWLQAREVPAALDAAHLEMYSDGLRRATEHARLLADILAALDRSDRERARVLAQQGFRSGGPLYALGQAMARAIEAASGPTGLAATVTGGPLAFLRAYEAAARGVEGLMPAGLAERAHELESGYGRDPLLATRTRRDGLKLLEQSKNREAKSALAAAVKMDPTDAISAYNLACAEALGGHAGKAMKWLTEAFDRGFGDVKHAAVDEDLASLRDRKDFNDLIRARRPGSADPAPPPVPRPDDPDASR